MDGKLANGDMGGNKIPVVDVFGKKLDNLHKLWDSALGLYDEVGQLPIVEAVRQRVDEEADRLMKKYPESFFGDLAQNIDVSKWAEESHGYAEDIAYSDIDIFPALRP